MAITFSRSDLDLCLWVHMKQLVYHAEITIHGKLREKFEEAAN